MDDNEPESEQSAPVHSREVEQALFSSASLEPPSCFSTAWFEPPQASTQSCCEIENQIPNQSQKSQQKLIKNTNLGQQKINEKLPFCRLEALVEHREPLPISNSDCKFDRLKKKKRIKYSNLRIFFFFRFLFFKISFYWGILGLLET